MFKTAIAPASLTGGFRLDEILSITKSVTAADSTARSRMDALSTLRAIAERKDVYVSNAKALGAINLLFKLPMPKSVRKSELRDYARGARKMSELIGR